MKNRSSEHFDPAVRAAEKAARREQDMEDLAAGRVTREELARRNSIFRNVDVRQAKIVSSPRTKLKI